MIEKRTITTARKTLSPSFSMDREKVLPSRSATTDPVSLSQGFSVNCRKRFTPMPTQLAGQRLGEVLNYRSLILIDRAVGFAARNLL